MHSLLILLYDGYDLLYHESNVSFILLFPKKSSFSYLLSPAYSMQKGPAPTPPFVQTGLTITIAFNKQFNDYSTSTSQP